MSATDAIYVAEVKSVPAFPLEISILKESWLSKEENGRRSFKSFEDT